MQKGQVSPPFVFLYSVSALRAALRAKSAWFRAIAFALAGTIITVMIFPAYHRARRSGACAAVLGDKSRRRQQADGGKLQDHSTTRLKHNNSPFFIG